MSLGGIAFGGSSWGLRESESGKLGPSSSRGSPFNRVQPDPVKKSVPGTDHPTTRHLKCLRRLQLRREATGGAGSGVMGETLRDTDGREADKWWNRMG
eukprot:763730-Hanusia_phi.AAC.6